MALTVLSHVPAEALERARKLAPDVEIVAIPPEGPLPEGLASRAPEVLLTFARGTPNLADVVRSVRWIHTIGTGVDGFPLDAVGDRILTCSRGASAAPIAEWTLAMLLAFEKDLPGSWLSGPPERWNVAPLGTLDGKTLGLVGLGSIGRAVATRAAPFGMRLRALRRTPGRSGVPGVESAGSLEELLEASDHLVVAAPATEATRQLIGRDALAHVKPGAHIVNVARGSLVDQEALREALDDGRVARASLDVVEPEPLPAGHWLYAHPRVRLSAHVSWCMPGAVQRLFDTFAENLRRYRAGEPLHGRVDIGAGY